MGCQVDEATYFSDCPRGWPVDDFWDGPFVVFNSTDKDAYQLATSNGHILGNLVNWARVRKLNESERKKYTGDFWEASSRLKLHDQLDQKQLQDLNVELRKATLANIEAQRLGKPAPLTQIVEISTRKRETEKLLRSEANLPSPPPPAPWRPANVFGVSPCATAAHEHFIISCLA